MMLRAAKVLLAVVTRAVVRFTPEWLLPVMGWVIGALYTLYVLRIEAPATASAEDRYRILARSYLDAGVAHAQSAGLTRVALHESVDVLWNSNLLETPGD